jgi:methylenetetrahydrofolate--tRNA-(uracil-5-)-methyltransferase
MSGALLRALTSGEVRDFNPTQVQFGLLPPLGEKVRGRKKRDHLRAERALEDMASWLEEQGLKPRFHEEVADE